MTNSNRTIHINLETKMVNLKGIQLEGQDNKKMTLRDILVSAILSETGAKDAVRSWKLSNKIYNNEGKILTTDETEIEYIIGIVEKSQDSPMVKGQTLEILKDEMLKAINEGKIKKVETTT
jgi:hypothetical protein